MEIQIAVAKTSKYAVSESGDTLEVVERPNGGVSVVLCDGQTSGRGAKAVSVMVVRKIIGLLAEGVRDGAAARAASDSLYTDKKGKVSASLHILSVDLQTGTLVITRNTPTPVLIARDEAVECLAGDSKPLGTARNIRPSITELPLQVDTTIVLFTDGITFAGDRSGNPLDVCAVIQGLVDDQNPSAQIIADTLLEHAIQLDDHRPNDDMSVVVLRVMPNMSDGIRRMTVRLPVDPLPNM